MADEHCSTGLTLFELLWGASPCVLTCPVTLTGRKVPAWEGPVLKSAAMRETKAPCPQAPSS